MQVSYIMLGRMHPAPPSMGRLQHNFCSHVLNWCSGAAMILGKSRGTLLKFAKIFFWDLEIFGGRPFKKLDSPSKIGTVGGG